MEVLDEASKIETRVRRLPRFGAEELANLIREARYDEISKRNVARVLHHILEDEDGSALLEYANSPVQVDTQEARPQRCRPSTGPASEPSRHHEQPAPHFSDEDPGKAGLGRSLFVPKGTGERAVQDRDLDIQPVERVGGVSMSWVGQQRPVRQLRARRRRRVPRARRRGCQETSCYFIKKKNEFFLIIIFHFIFIFSIFIFIFGQCFGKENKLFETLKSYREIFFIAKSKK
jgi:hypothetical protein